jgi:hypothetical protein
MDMRPSVNDKAVRPDSDVPALTNAVLNYRNESLINLNAAT